jgi:5-formyltetrahydrofolate cyclo-ligase
VEKAKARSAWRRQCGTISKAEFADGSRLIIDKLRSLDEVKSARVVMAYVPLAAEVDVKPLLEKFVKDGKTVVLPALTGEAGRMDAHEVKNLEKDLAPGRFGLMQPAEGIPIDPRLIDLILVPAVAFDLHGRRLGRGGGYYDRFLAGRATNAFACGVAFDCQVQDVVPVRDHDHPVHMVVTEKRILRFPKT